jgi:integrating conjugative element protein (TIGR03752 family)
MLAGVVVLMLAFVTIKSCSNEPDDRVVMDAVPQAPVPDADTPADTIKTLTANVAAMTTEVEALRQDNTTLRNDNRQLLNNHNQIEESVTTRVKRDLLSRESDQAVRQQQDSSLLSSLTARVDALSQSLSPTLSQAKPSQGVGDIPVGLGFDSSGAGAAPAAGMVWIDPLDASADDSNTANASNLLQQVRHSTTGALSSAREQSGNIVRELDTLRPVYTVPRNATLIGSTAMTALVGRVPIQGQVRDPMSFKVITGADNLAANGLTVPGVQGMVWSGTAIGDWTLSCVTGRLDSVTFVFDDGTIRTISADERGGSEARQSGGGNRPLGWISDQQGIPCISGDRKTNAPAFLTQRIGVKAMQAAADAAAAAETTTVLGQSGVATSTITGDTGSFILGRTVAGGSDEVAKWLMERQSQSFDAVFVPAGTRLAIHVDVALPIDLDLKGRKLDHANAINPYHRARLD